MHQEWFPGRQFWGCTGFDVVTAEEELSGAVNEAP